MVDSLGPINSRDPISNQDLDKTKNQKKANSAGSDASEASRNDEVVISSLAKDINTVRESLERTTQETDRINQIKDQIDKGEYKIDSAKIAEKIIHDREVDKTT